MQKFLIIQTAFPGDVILATVIIEKLHACMPAAEIDFLLRKGNEELLDGHPYLSEILAWDKKQDKTSNLLRLINIIRRKKYDKVINVQRFFSTGLLTAFSTAKETIGFDKNPLSFLFDKKIKHIIGTKEHPVHEVDRNLALVKHFACDADVRPKLYPSDRDFNTVAAILNSNLKPQTSNLKQYICVAPSSVWFTKQYPKEKWISFLSQVPQQLPVFFIGANTDKDLCDAIIAGLPAHQSVNLCGQLSFLQSAALMKNAVMNYVNDSAPIHLASAMNAPVTAIFCSTVTWFGFWPLSEKSIVVQKEEPLYCRPCTLHGKKECPEKHFKCALDIRDAQLMASLHYD
ncbi:MAG TPA: glycosyltransferase family 9 protein [Parafilimonas sp.]|nr:glycosyltransferase family 9 protein [Parafilimonas sp.]